MFVCLPKNQATIFLEKFRQLSISISNFVIITLISFIYSYIMHINMLFSPYNTDWIKTWKRNWKNQSSIIIQMPCMNELNWLTCFNICHNKILYNYDSNTKPLKHFFNHNGNCFEFQYYFFDWKKPLDNMICCHWNNW